MTMHEVRTLIAALTTERNAIDRAIAGLQQMSEIRGVDAAKPTAKNPRLHRQRYTKDVKAQIVARLKQAAIPSREARTLAREYGIPYNTVQSNWQRWQREIINNGNQPPDVNGNHADALGVPS